MISNFRKFSSSKIAAVFVFLIAAPLVFAGFFGGFGSNNQNNIAKINKTNVTTQEFIDYVNQSGISQEAIRDNLDNNIIEELLSGLISTTLIDLEVKDFGLSINEITVLKNIKENKNFHDENGIFQRVKYEKFLLSNNMSAPMFELQLKNLPSNFFRILQAKDGLHWVLLVDFLIEIFSRCKNYLLGRDFF